MNLCIESTEYKITYSKRNTYLLDLGYKIIPLRFCQLLAFRKKILEYTSYECLENIIDNDNFVLVFVADRKHLLYLEVSALIQLRNLVMHVFKPSTSLVLQA